MTCDCGDVPYIKASFIKGISRGGLLILFLKNKCYVLANNSVKNVPVTLWFCLQRSCKKCL